MLDVGVVRGLIIPVLVALHAPVSPGAQRAAIVLAKRSSSSDAGTSGGAWPSPSPSTSL